MIVPADTPMTPNINTIVGGFAGIVGLFILREFRRLYDWNQKNDGLPNAVRKINHALFGDEEGHVGLVAQLKRIADQLTAHCNDERRFWDEVRDGREAIANRAQVTISQSETRLRDDFTGQFEELSRKVEALAERRRKPR